MKTTITGNTIRPCLFIAVILLLVTASTGDVFGIWIEPYLKQVDLEGITHVRVISYRFNNGQWEEIDTCTGNYTPEGTLISETRHNARGELQYEYHYTYNNKNEMIKISGRRLRREVFVPYLYHYSYDGRGNQIEGIGYGEDGSETSRYKARFDERNNFIEGVEYRGGTAVSKYTAEYNDENLLTEENKYTVYRYKGEERYQVDYTHLFSYDGNNNMTEEKNYGTYGRFESHYVYEYDRRGNIVEGINYSEEGSVISGYSAEFDRNNNLITSIHYGPDNEITSRHKARYDTQGHMIEEIDSTGGTEKIIYQARFDDSGNLLEETHYSQNMMRGSELSYRYSYAYDKHNNRIEETYYVLQEEENRWKPLSRQVNELKYVNSD